MACDLGKAEQLVVIVTNRVDDDAGPKECAVLADAPAFFFVAAVLQCEPQGARRPAGRLICGRIETRKVLADDFSWRVALDALPPGVPVADDPVGVQHVKPLVGAAVD